VDELLGRVLADRYEIVQEVGSGGMAVVYLGQDRLLCRPVAIKILRDVHAKDEDFVRRFRLEAQAAASLSHPNVVNMYDVGEENGIYYIVMEYLNGTDLKTLIRQYGQFSVGQGLWVAAEIAKALEHAHSHKIVHRDIKPHNIILTNDGRIKVTDFGIARAVSSSTLTQTGFVLGSVHYSSPEQVSGGQISGASDLYSLGVVMYEMFTGRLPFGGETPVSIALKHLRDQPPSLRELRGDLPDGVALIVETAMAKEPKDRYPSAARLLQAIQKTGMMSLGFASEEAPEQTALMETTKVLASVNGEELEPTEMVPVQQKKKRSTGARFLTVVAVLLAIGGLSWVGLLQARKMIFPPDLPVPEVSGRSLEEASEILSEMGFKPSVDGRVFSHDVPEGWVVSQNPVEGRIVKKWRTVELIVSKGPQMVEVPNIVGYSLRDAALMLDEQGLKLGVPEEEINEQAAIDEVLFQEPSSGSVPVGSSINVVIAVRQKSTVLLVPDIRGSYLDQAQKDLAEYGLSIGKSFPDFSDEIPQGMIIDQNPRPQASVQKGTAIDVVYSNGPRNRQEPREDETGVGTPPVPPVGELEPGEDTDAQTPPEAPNDGQKRATISIRVPDGPPQEVLILVVDDIRVGIKQVMQAMVDGGETITRVVVGYGPEVRVQVYLGGWLIEEEYLR